MVCGVLVEKVTMNQTDGLLSCLTYIIRLHFCRAQKELIEKEQREDSLKHRQRIVHRDDVLDQIRDKEQQKISERNAFFEEGIRLDEEARLRRLKLDEVKRKKLGELR